MNQKISQDFFQMVEKMPPFPKSAHRIMELAADINCNPKDLVQVIEHDPIVTMKLLKLVNSAFFSLAHEITSIRHALVYLGLNTVKNLALSIATIQSIPHKNLEHFNTHQFLLHALTTASIAQRIAPRFDPDLDTGDAFIAGLLHDFGKMVFAQFAPLEFSQAIELSIEKKQSLHLSEQAVMGMNHAEMGALLAEKWELPHQLIQCIRYHHQDSQAPLHCAVVVANQISKQLKFGNACNPVIDAFTPHIEGILGMNLSDFIESLDDLSTEASKAKKFIDI
ncbi:MAG: HDOD domain-containing protein [Mariprofundaceae bacterium]|nr:HDOD domain-containing protein [Mariprofundaceae bacterium]